MAFSVINVSMDSAERFFLRDLHLAVRVFHRFARPSRSRQSSLHLMLYNQAMHPVIMLTTAILAVVFVSACAATWLIWRGRIQPRPFVERAAMALMFGPIGWQALAWLSTAQPAASDTQRLAVWVQLVSALGSATLLLAYGWLSRRRQLHA